MNPHAPQNTRIEINANYLNSIDRTAVASWDFSIRTLFLEHRSLCEGAYQSLRQKAATVSASSKALLEAALGEKIVKLVANRLQGGDVSGDLRQMLDEQIRDTLLNRVMPDIRRACQGTTLTKLGFKVDENFTWLLENEGDDFDLDITWQSLRYRSTGRTRSVYLMRQSVGEICVRDCFLLAVNISGFGDKIARTIERVGKLET